MQSKPLTPSVSDSVAAVSPELALMHQESTGGDLADRMKRGDSTALAELYDSTSPMVYGIMVRILGEGPAAQDGLVEAYGQAWSQIQAFDSRRSCLLSWLVLLARRVALERPERQAPLLEAVPADDRRTLERAFFDGAQEGDLRGALMRLREKKGGDAR